jgi:hypothetical protein
VSSSASSPSANPSAGVDHSGAVLVHRVRFFCGMAVAAVIFWYVGWWAADPVDPEGPITLLLVEQGVITMAELLGLAVVSAGLGVAICGARSAHRGPLAVAVGLAAMGLRGGELDRLVLLRLAPGLAGRTEDPFPVWAMVSETWLWLALIGVGFVVGHWVDSWWSAGRREPDTAADHSADVRQGIGTLVATALVAWTLLYATSGAAELPPLKGQIYFSIGISFLVGSLVAHAFFRRSTPVWPLVAIALVAAAAYSIGGPSRELLEAAREQGGYVALPPMARPLPLEFAALGAIGILIEPDIMRGLRLMFGLSAEPGPANQSD